MDDIKVMFEKMLKKPEASIVRKNQEMFHKQEQSMLALTSGNNSLKNQRLDSLLLVKSEYIWLFIILNRAHSRFSVDSKVF